jgi:hypothetical protein
MVGPIVRTILQSVGNVLFDPGWEVLDVCISEPGIFEVADIETELLNHRLQAGNPQLHVRVSEADSVVAVTVVADKKIGN